ncbi:hypothetical protein [Deinococcus humi]|uniref:Uncharacterized protein n=1 Tax=Deinococcus humi TaxID=662880 RepID=A0A7W8NEM1_9DEIO|nr:hypothetical protein [Deinococcus humi]MBB5364499.1 hypothetical protein [Deinococcus humi]GGO32897.1 hypothetical protein GCM10008949_31220 [Deinococcus humi]
MPRDPARAAWEANWQQGPPLTALQTERDPAALLGDTQPAASVKARLKNVLAKVFPGH